MSESTKKALAIAGGVVGTALLIWPLAVWLEVRKCEKPKYKVLQTLGSLTRSFYDRAPYIEIREYAPFVIAEVIVEGRDMKEASSAGFTQVASYIFGGNGQKGKGAVASQVQTEVENGKEEGKKGETIAMTSPVQMEMVGGKYKVAFVMPSKYSSSRELPPPNNPRIQLKDVPAHTLAALSWRGWPRPSDDVVKAKENELRKALSDARVRIEEGANTRLYQYYPPFAPQAMRLQDVLLAVRKETVNGKDQ